MSFATIKAAAVLILAGIITSAACPARERAPQMIDQNGHAFTFASLQGRPLVVTFVAARCKEACPLINARFAQAQALFDRDRIDARLLTITLEPQNDTLAVMRDLARRFRADSRRWLFATGNVKDVRAIMDALGVRGNNDEHTTFVYVFDRKGRFRDRLLASSVLELQLAGELRRVQ